MKTINVRPASEILIKLEDEEYILTFNTTCLMKVQQYVQEVFKSDEIDGESYDKILPAIIYGAMNAKKEVAPFEKAKEIAKMMTIENGIQIINDFTDSIKSSLTDEQKKNLQQFMTKKTRKLI